MVWIKRIGAGVLAACMACSLASCSDTSWAYKSAKSTLPAGAYIAMLGNSYLTAVGQLSSTSTDATTTIWDQTIGDTNVETYILNNAKETATAYLAIKDKFDELGLTLTEEEQSSLETTATQMWSYYNQLIDYEESGVSEDSFTEFSATNTRQNKLFDYYYGKGGKEEVKDPELKKFYNKNYCAVKVVTVTLTDEEGGALTDENEIKKLEKQAKSYQKRMQNGEDPDKIINEYNGATGSDQQTASTDKNANVSLITEDGTKLAKKVFKAKAGDVFYVKDTDNNYIYVGKKYDVRDFEDVYQSSRDSVLHKYKDEDFQKLVDEWSKAVQVTANDAAIKRYSPRNIVTKEQ